jgi:hypothetical protein
MRRSFSTTLTQSRAASQRNIVIMSSSKIITVTHEHWPTLVRAPRRGIAFMRGLLEPRIRRKLEAAGLDETERARCARYLEEANEALADVAPDAAPPSARPQDDLHAWYASTYTLARASLAHRHPEQEAFVFGNLAIGDVAGAIVNAKLFLDRLDALHAGADRKATRKADRAALATLERRGVTKARREEGRARLAATLATMITSAPEPIDRTEAERKLARLDAWLDEWSAMARAVLGREELIKLGVLRPRRVKKPPVIVAPTADEAVPPSRAA